MKVVYVFNVFGTKLLQTINLFEQTSIIMIFRSNARGII
jgi:hypothetical protein